MPIKMAPSRLSTASAGRFQRGQAGSAKTADAFYVSAEWKAFRNQLIRERGWRCEDPSCDTPRGAWKQIYGDHVVEIKDGGAPLDRANVLLRCSVCHGRKTRREREKRAGLVDPVVLTGGD